MNQDPLGSQSPTAGSPPSSSKAPLAAQQDIQEPLFAAIESDTMFQSQEERKQFVTNFLLRLKEMNYQQQGDERVFKAFIKAIDKKFWGTARIFLLGKHIKLENVYLTFFAALDRAASDPDNLKVAELFADDQYKFVDINLKFPDTGNAVLHRYVLSNNKEACRFLWNLKSIDKNAVNSKGKTALALAMELRYVDIVEVFDPKKAKKMRERSTAATLTGASPAASPKSSPTASPTTSSAASPTGASSPALGRSRKDSGSKVSPSGSEDEAAPTNPLMDAITSNPPNSATVAKWLQFRGNLKQHPYFEKKSDDEFAKEIYIAFDKALELGHIAIAALFVDYRNNVDINATTRGDKTTFLHRYALKGILPAVQFIFRHEKFEKHYETNTGGENALHIAAAQGNVDIVNFLLSEPIKKSTFESITSALSIGNTEVNPFLVKKDALGYYPLQRALQAKKADVFKILLPQMPEDIVKELAPSMLKFAMENGAFEILCCLLADTRIDISPKSHGDDSLLNTLITDLFKKLNEHTAAKLGLWKTIITAIAGRSSNKFNFSIQNNNGHTPLHTAISMICTTGIVSESEMSTVVQFLDPLIAAAGKSINAKDRSGLSPLQYAVQMRVDSRAGSMASKISLKIIEKLLENPNCDAKEINVFNVATERNDNELFHLLNKQRSVVSTNTAAAASSPYLGSPATQDNDGNNALHLLVAKGDTDKITTLLARSDIGAALNAATNQGCTPLTLAMEILSKHPKIVLPPPPVAEPVAPSHASSAEREKGRGRDASAKRAAGKPGTPVKKPVGAISRLRLFSDKSFAAKLSTDLNNGEEDLATTQPAATLPNVAVASPPPAPVLDKHQIQNNAIHDTQVQIIELFLAHTELNPNFQPERGDRFNKDALFDTALHMAVKLRNVGLARKILSLKGKYPTDPNKADKNGNRPLDIAVMNGDSAMVAVLLNHRKSNRSDDKTITTDPNRYSYYGAPLRNATGISPLHYAFQQLTAQPAKKREYDEIVKSLLAHPAIDVNEKNMDRDAGGETPLHVAIRQGRVNIVRLLLENKNIKPNLANNCNETPLMKETPLMLAVRCFSPDNVATKEIVKLLLDHPHVKPDFDPRDSNLDRSDALRKTPFNVAIEIRNPDLLKLFLDTHLKAQRDHNKDKLIDLDKKNGQERTPLIVAMHQMMDDSARRHGGSEAQSEAPVAILAQSTVTPEIIANLLLQYGANPNIVGYDEGTHAYSPAEFAVVNGQSHRKLLLNLIKHGAKIDPNKNYYDVKHPFGKFTVYGRRQRAAFPDDFTYDPGLILFYDLTATLRGRDEGELTKDKINARVLALKQHIRFYKEMKDLLFVAEKDINFNMGRDVLSETDSLISNMESRIKTTELELRGTEPAVKNSITDNDLRLILAVNKATYLTYALIKNPHTQKHREEYSNIRDYLSDSRFGRKLAGAIALILTVVCLLAVAAFAFCTFPYALPLVPLMEGAGAGAGVTFVTGSTCLFFSNSRRAVIGAMDTLKEETGKLPAPIQVR